MRVGSEAIHRGGRSGGAAGSRRGTPSGSASRRTSPEPPSISPRTRRRGRPAWSSPSTADSWRS